MKNLAKKLEEKIKEDIAKSNNISKKTRILINIIAILHGVNVVQNFKRIIFTII